MSAHVDFVRNDWHNQEQVKLGVVRAEIEGRHDLEIAFLHTLSDRYDGSYFFMTEPHGEDTCPFKDSDRVKMRSIPV